MLLHSKLLYALNIGEIKEIYVNLALFDFDGTITDKDMYTKFLHYSASKRRAIIGNLCLLPFYLLYKHGWFSARKLRFMSSYLAFKGRDFDALNKVGKVFSQEVIPHYLRDNALERIRRHKENGDEVVVVSASLNIYLRHWCTEFGLTLICNELEVNNGKCSGHYVSDDCSCENKSNKVHASYDLNKYDCIYAYGDTYEDIALLELADEKYMNWEKVIHAIP
jgi:HAD superfamily hydrolase (TIGR01490 family)